MGDQHQVCSAPYLDLYLHGSFIPDLPYKFIGSGQNGTIVRRLDED